MWRQNDGTEKMLFCGDQFGIINNECDQLFHGQLITLNNKTSIICCPASIWLNIINTTTNETIKWLTKDSILKLLIDSNDQNEIESLILCHPLYCSTEEFIEFLLKNVIKNQEKIILIVTKWIKLHAIQLDDEQRADQSLHCDLFELKFYNQFLLTKLFLYLNSTQIQMINFQLSICSSHRTLSLNKSMKNEQFPFEIISSSSHSNSHSKHSHSLFIHKVNDSSLQLLVGDEIIEFNGNSSCSLQQCNSQLLNCTLIQLTVKFNPHKYYQLINNTTSSHPTSYPSSHQLQVIKVFNVHNEYKLISCLSSTTTKEIVMLALAHHNLYPSNQISHLQSRDFNLYEVKLLNDMKSLKIRLIQSDSNDIQSRCELLASRFYIKSDLIPQHKLNDELMKSEILKEFKEFHSCDSLFDLNVKQLAIEMTNQQLNKLNSICPINLFDDLFVSNMTSHNSNLKSLKSFESSSNTTFYWTLNQVLIASSNSNERMKCVKILIKLCFELLHLNNYNSLFSILMALNHTSIQRLKCKISNKLNDLNELMNPSKNMANYRAKLNQFDGQSTFVPFFPLVKKDLIFLKEANRLMTSSQQYNVEQIKLLSTTILQLFSLINAKQQCSVQTDVSCPKKYWEENQMKRRCKNFLDNSMSQLVQDEDELLARSLNIEPIKREKNNSHSNSHPSPTPSSSSSQSSQQHCVKLKFGAESESEMNKLLSLSKPSKLHTHSHSHSHHNSYSSSSSSSSSSSQLSLSQFNSIQQFYYFPPSHHHSHPASHSHFINSNSHSSLSLPNYNQPSQSHSHSHGSSSSSTLLPIESSSVTSLRKLEQLEQLKRYQHNHIHIQNHISPPSYMATMQRIKQQNHSNSNEKEHQV